MKIAKTTFVVINILGILISCQFAHAVVPSASEMFGRRPINSGTGESVLPDNVPSNPPGLGGESDDEVAEAPEEVPRGTISSDRSEKKKEDRKRDRKKDREKERLIRTGIGIFGELIRGANRHDDAGYRDGDGYYEDNHYYNDDTDVEDEEFHDRYERRRNGLRGFFDSFF